MWLVVVSASGRGKEGVSQNCKQLRANKGGKKRPQPWNWTPLPGTLSRASPEGRLASQVQAYGHASWNWATQPQPRGPQLTRTSSPTLPLRELPRGQKDRSRASCTLSSVLWCAQKCVMWVGQQGGGPVTSYCGSFSLKFTEWGRPSVSAKWGDGPGSASASHLWVSQLGALSIPGASALQIWHPAAHWSASTSMCSQVSSAPGCWRSA